MIKTEIVENNFIKTYSNNNKMIRPIYDRLGKEINPDALYSEAVDIVVNGLPRYEYEETEIEIESEQEDLDETMQPLNDSM